MTTIWTGKPAVKTWLVSLTNNNYTLFCMAYPSAHHTSPPNDTGLEPWVWADSSSPQYCTPLYTCSILDHYIRADRNVGSYPTVSSYLSSWILRSKKNIVIVCVKNLYFKWCVLFTGYSISKFKRVYIEMTKIPKSTHYLLNYNLNQYTYSHVCILNELFILATMWFFREGNS